MTRAPQRRRASAVASLSLAAVIAVLLPALPAQADERPEPAGPALRVPAAADATDRFIVKFREQAGRSSIKRSEAYGRAADDLDLPLEEVRSTASGARVLQTPEALEGAEADELIARLEADPAVAYAEPDTILYPAAADPNDEFYAQQWNLWDYDFGIRAADAWGASRGDGVVVAVVDTGITGHPDLDANVLPGYDMIADAADARDGNGRDANARDEGDWVAANSCGFRHPAVDSSWHGTHVAGTIAAATNNGRGVAGVAPGAKILPVRALGVCGGYTSDIADGIVWATGGAVPGVPTTTTPAKVVNLSLGGPGLCSAPDPDEGRVLQDAVDSANRAGAVVVVAAGNENTNASASSPANCEDVITVGASGPRGARAPYSNYGAVVDVAAPGGDATWSWAGGIASTVNDGLTKPVIGPAAETYAFYEGTSSAAPHVAGVAALLLAAEPTLTPAEVEARIKQSARPLACTVSAANPKVAKPCGSGLVDAPAALGLDGTLGQEFVRGTPTVTGTPIAGSRLTASTGAWQPAGAAFTYQWFSDGFELAGETGRQYVVHPLDVKTHITVVVKGAKDGYRTATKRSANFGRIPQSSGPKVDGTRAVGKTLTARPGSWTPGSTLGYEWFRSGTKIANATASTYRLTTGDLGKTIKVRVTGKRTGYLTASRTSGSTAAVAKGTLTGASPTISGTRKVGHTLRAVPGSWTGGSALRYQWLRSGVAIKGATASSYRPAANDVGRRLAVRVTGSKAAYTTLSKTSGPTAGVAKGTLAAATPTVSGTARVGSTLRAAAGTWTAGTSLRYQWYRSGAAIAGASADTYRLVAGDRADTIKVRVTGWKAGYSMSHRTSAATAVVR